ncbi:MAG TPA: LysR family transcriptional regulator [Anaeromyxobacter sp.]|nr:LysR family transcriptional regulator [Anaeromyxobacter sp.]
MLEPQDYRDVLVMAGARSLKAAAATLGVDPSTMGRRLEAIELRFGARLFLRTARGLEPTGEAAAIVAAAERMEAARLDFERELLARRPRFAGGLTVTAAEWGVALLTPVLGELALRYPELPLRLRIENRTLDLARREADVALRVGRPREATLTGRRLGVAAYGLYGAAAYLAAHPPLRTRADATAHRFCALDESLARTPAMRWQADLAGTAPVVLRTNSLLALMEATRGGYGLATLPCVLAERHPELVRLLPEHDVVVRDVWLVFHRDLRSSRSVRRVVEALVEGVRPYFARGERAGGGGAPPPLRPSPGRPVRSRTRPRGSQVSL